MADAAIKASRRVLEPADRMAEILFGLIMALTFTCSISVATDGQTEVRTMLLGALGCNVAWGLIDGVFYLIGCLAEKAHALGTLRAVRSSGDPSAAALLIAEALPRAVASVLTREEIETVRLRLLALPEPARAARLV